MQALFVPFAPSLAHVSRCLAVAEAWRARGHTAIFAVGPERTEMVQAAGFATRSLPEVSGAVFRTDRGFRWLTREYFIQNLDVEQGILAEVQPDVVVFDFRFTTVVTARLAHLPSVSILHGNALRLARQPRETALRLLGDPGELRGIAALRLRVMGRLFPIIFQYLFQSVARRFAPIFKMYTLPPVNSLFELLLGDEIFVADLPDLLPFELLDNSHVVGPLLWSGWDYAAPWLDELEAQSLVYVTMGSTVEARTVLVKIIEALREAPYNVVVSIGNLSLPASLRLPAHIRVFPTVPGTAVLRRSAAVVHHGGHGTLMQALAAGVPSLIIPANPDQILMAQQVQALGVGRSLWRPNGLPLGTSRLNTMTPAQLRAEIDGLIADHKCRQTCQIFKQKLATYRGAEAAAEILERVAKGD